MTPERLRECLGVLGWSGGALARQLDCRDELVRRWLSGARGYTVPELVADWIERRVEAALADPPPERWKRNLAEEVATVS